MDMNLRASFPAVLKGAEFVKLKQDAQYISAPSTAVGHTVSDCIPFAISVNDFIEASKMQLFVFNIYNI